MRLSGAELLRHSLAGFDRRRAALWARRFGLYRRITARTAPLTGRLLMKQLRYIGLPDALYPLFRQDGYYLLKEHFYRPFTNPDSLPPDYWARRSELAGIAIDADACLDRARRDLAPYFTEFRETYPIEKPAENANGFWLINGSYMAVDAHLYYALIRHLRPSRIVEVGAGRSTIVAAEACRRNNVAVPGSSQLICIEPYPTAIVTGGLAHLAELMQTRVEEVDLGFFELLETGDILFIDSSHALREAGDVQFLYCEVLPRLRPGVAVHVHDVSLPKPYPRVYFDHGWFWNEQYLLQAYLTHNARAEVLWPGNFLMCHRPDEMNALFPEIAIMRQHFPSSEPSAFWFRTK